MKSVCLVTSGNVASNPRLVKEAGALKEAGYSVRIVAADIIRSLSAFDREIVEQLNCDVMRVRWNGPLLVKWLRKLRRKGAQVYASCFARIPLRVAALAFHPLTSALARSARARPADLYLAHNLAALPAAASAALKHRAALGFDAEDYHCGELDSVAEHGLELQIRRCLEAALLPRCAHLTSASGKISDAYARDYGVNMTTVLNVFPLCDAPEQPVSPQSGRGLLPSLYWFSQTLGPNRGLEQIVDAVAVMRTKVRLVLRGDPADRFTDALQLRARQKGGDELMQRVTFATVARPAEMVRAAADHDLGLAVEVPHTISRDICLTNKAFTYLLAGIPVLFSRTTAQSQLAADLGRAALLTNIQDAHATAAVLDMFFGDRAAQTAARQAAWTIGRRRYHWDVEKHAFLRSVEAALACDSSGV